MAVFLGSPQAQPFFTPAVSRCAFGRGRCKSRPSATGLGGDWSAQPGWCRRGVGRDVFVIWLVDVVRLIAETDVGCYPASRFPARLGPLLFPKKPPHPRKPGLRECDSADKRVLTLAMTHKGAGKTRTWYRWERSY